MNDSQWSIIETDFDIVKLHHHETIFTLGNGYLSTRGAFEEGLGGAWPMTLLHGVYDTVPVYYTELVNCPDWLPLTVTFNGSRFRLDQGSVLRYRRELDLRAGLLRRRVRWQSPAGQTIDLRFERLVSLADPHVMAIRCEIAPLDFRGTVEVQASLNGYTDNVGFMHWEWMDQGSGADSVWLHETTRQSAIELGMAACLQVDGAPDAQVQAVGCQGYPTISARFTAGPGQTVTVDKLVTVFTLRDTPAPAQAARVRLAALPDYEALRAAHESEWAEVWADSDVQIEGDPLAQLATRYSLFQLIAAAPRRDTWSSIPAKALSGHGYRGHIFWDTDIFVAPFLTFTQTALASNLLTYRYNTLPGARRKALAAGYEGAMFAWESAATGDEVTPRWLPGPRGEELVRIWCGDIELHISADVAYAVWYYWQATGDDAWMARYGAEIILDTAVFWGSRAEWNAERGCYEIHDVIGPDEYHDHVHNNAFTNRMVRWHLTRALEVLDWLRGNDAERAALLEEQLDLSPERLNHWLTVAGSIYVPHDRETGLIEQFEGYFGLTDVDLPSYEPRVRSMQALLGIEGANAHQAIKQADVLMLLYLLSDEYDRRTLQANWDYYAPRTDHTYGSSLGPAVHAILAGRLGRPAEAYEHLMRAALVDIDDLRGNAADGLHAAAAGGVWQALVFGFGGVRLEPDGPVADPHLPAHWTRLRFRLQYRGRWFDFDLSQQAAPDIPLDGGETS